MCLTIDELRGLCTPDNIYLTLHASKRLEQRGILIDDVISCIMTGEIIEEYPNDYPYIITKTVCLFLNTDSFFLTVLSIHPPESY